MRMERCAHPFCARNENTLYIRQLLTVGGADAEMVPTAGRLRECRQVHFGSCLQNAGVNAHYTVSACSAG